MALSGTATEWNCPEQIKFFYLLVAYFVKQCFTAKLKLSVAIKN